MVWEAADRICGKRLRRRCPIWWSPWSAMATWIWTLGCANGCGQPAPPPWIGCSSICTGWTEAVPLLAREQSLVVAGLEAIGRQLPFPVKGIDSDNDSVFINATLTQHCAERGIEFTRSRPYRKNDQAWIEQKNGAVVRHFAGHDRYSGAVAGQTMAHLYGAVRQYVNYFQPSRIASIKPLPNASGCLK